LVCKTQTAVVSSTTINGDPHKDPCWAAILTRFDYIDHTTQ
jgi:hypothetical protein